MQPCRHYFAFGSNMNPQRVRERGLVFGRVDGAWLVDYRLLFDKTAAVHAGTGHANIEPAPGDRVEGVVYELVHDDEILKMDPFEQVPVNYLRHQILVQTRAGTQRAWTYIANDAVRQPGLLPERAYLDHLLCGAPWLSPEYHARLAAWPVAGSNSTPS